MYLHAGPTLLSEVNSEVLPGVSVAAHTPNSAPAVQSEPPQVSSEVIQQIVATVTAQVTANLQSARADGTAQAVNGASSSSALRPSVTVSSLSTSHPSVPLVAKAVENAQSILTGEPVLHDSSGAFQSISLPLDVKVPQKIKSKIWSHEYIDFSVLFPEPELLF